MSFEINPEKRSTPRRANIVPRLTDDFAFQRIVKLPLDLAIIHSAAQNFRLDLAMGYHVSSGVWEDIKHDYLEEALAHMNHFGFNMFPGFNDEPWIHGGQIGNFSANNSRSAELCNCYDLAFAREPEKLIAIGLFPDSRKHNNAVAIQKLYAEMFKRRVMH